MKFEVVNEKNQTVMQTTDIVCIPTGEELKLMAKSGYKFRIGGKIVRKSDLLKLIDEVK